MTPKWSVVVCCHNSAPRIAATLEALDRQRWAADHPVEIVVVDNNCSDETVALAQQHRFASRCYVRVVAEPRPGVGFARARGIQEATGTYVCYTDDDNLLDPDYLDNAAAILDGRSDVVFCGGESAFPASYQVPLIARFFSKAIAVGKQREYPEGYITHGSFLWSAGLCVRRGELAALYASGFDPVLAGRTGRRVLSGEDGEITILLQLGDRRGYYSSSLRFVHRVNLDRLSLRYFVELLYGMGLAVRPLAEYERAVRNASLARDDRAGARQPVRERLARFSGYGPWDALRIVAYYGILGAAFAAGMYRGRSLDLSDRARAQAARLASLVGGKASP